jgi:hypothetical protein
LTKTSRPNRKPAEWKLTEHLTKFINNAFERRLRPSRALYDAVIAAKESGYSEDEIRLAFWVVRCVPSKEIETMGGHVWLKAGLINAHLSPELVLRHKGRVNPKTGAETKRWLDDMLSMADETSPNLVGGLLGQLPPEMQGGEKDLLKRMDVQFKPVF